MDVLVFYDTPDQVDEASAIAERLRVGNTTVGVRTARYYDPDQHEPAEKVVVFDVKGPAARAYKEAGATVVAASAADDAASEGPDGLPAGYSVAQAGSWYKAIGPDGEQIGKSKRSEEEALVLIREAAG